MRLYPLSPQGSENNQKSLRGNVRTRQTILRTVQQLDPVQFNADEKRLLGKFRGG